MKFKEFHLKEFKIGEKTIKPPLEVQEFAVVEFFSAVNLFIAQIDEDSINCPVNNVNAYDNSGNLVWTISQPTFIPTEKMAPFNYSLNRSIPVEGYEDIRFHYSGNDVYLDLRTGKTRFCNPQEALYFFSKNYTLPFGAYPETQLRLVEGFVVLAGSRGPDKIGPNNIFSFKDDGTLRWRIKWPKEVPYNEKDGYTSVYLEDGKLKGYLISGHLVEIDRKTGETSNPIFTR